MKKKKVVRCHCCKNPAIDDLGIPKKEPICWNCITHCGTVERGCTIHYPELYDEYAMPKKSK